MRYFIVLAVVVSIGFSFQDKQNQVQEEIIQKLIKDLGANDPKVRDEAQRKLIEVGKPALDLLQKASQSKDYEVKMRAVQIIDKIEFARGYEKLEKYKNYMKKYWAANGQKLELLTTESSINFSKYFPNWKILKAMSADTEKDVAPQDFGYIAICKNQSNLINLGGLSISMINPIIVRESFVPKNEQEVIDFVDYIQEKLGSEDLAQFSEKVYEKYETYSKQYWKVRLFLRDIQLNYDDSGKITSIY